MQQKQEWKQDWNRDEAEIRASARILGTKLWGKDRTPSELKEKLDERWKAEESNVRYWYARVNGLEQYKEYLTKFGPVGDTSSVSSQIEVTPGE